MTVPLWGYFCLCGWAMLLSITVIMNLRAQARWHNYYRAELENIRTGKITTIAGSIKNMRKVQP